MRFDLSDDDWALRESLMPKSRKSARADDRRIMNAIFYVLRTGMTVHDTDGLQTFLNSDACIAILKRHGIVQPVTMLTIVG